MSHCTLTPLNSEALSLAPYFSCVPQNGHATANTAVPRWQRDLNNAVVHGNRMDRQKLVQILCRCELGKGICVVVKDQGQGFDPNALPDPTVGENIGADHGRGIWVMKSVMDEVSFERGGTEVRMRKAPTRQPGTECEAATK